MLTITKELVSSGVVILIAMIVLTAINAIYRGYIKKSGIEDLKVRAFIKMCVEFVDIAIVLITILAVLQINNINISSMVTSVGIITAIAGLAMQDFLKDVLMGVHIINDKSFSVGDVIKVNGDEGQVVYFSLLTTRIKSVDSGDTVTFCNRNITQVAKSCGMYTVEIPLAYEEKPERVREIFEGVAAVVGKIPGITYSQYLGVQRYDSSAVVYKLRYDCSPVDKWPMNRAVMAEVQKAVIANGLNIPYNQIVVHSER